MKQTTFVMVGLLLLVLIFVACCSRRSGPLGAEHFDYDPNGRLKSRTTANGEIIHYQYTPTGQLSKLTYPRWPSVGFDYNAAHDLVAIHDTSGTTTWQRDAFGRISRMVLPNGQALSYAYDPWGRVIALSVSDSYTMHYSYDVLGRLTTVNDGYGQTTYTYRDGEVIRQLPNGIQSAFTVSPVGRLVSIVHRKPDGTVIGAFHYAYQADGKLSVVSEDTARSRTTQRYEYDLLGRLSAVQDSAGERIAYTYDALGNRTSEVSSTGALQYQYDASGRLVKRGTAVYTYDRAGNIVAVHDLTTHRTVEYAYDAANRLVEVRGPKQVRYAYDGLGNRIRRETAGSISYYLNDLNTRLSRTVALFDGAGKVKAYYLLADSRIGQRDGTGKALYYLADRMGSIRFVVDERGDVIREHQYSPFGQPVPLRGDQQGEGYV